MLNEIAGVVSSVIVSMEALVVISRGDDVLETVVLVGINLNAGGSGCGLEFTLLSGISIMGRFGSVSI